MTRRSLFDQRAPAPLSARQFIFGLALVLIAWGWVGGNDFEDEVAAAKAQCLSKPNWTWDAKTLSCHFTKDKHHAAP